MRVMAFMMGNEDSETGRIPDPEEFAAMGRFNEELVKAGILLSAEGLHATKDGAKVKWTGDGPTVVDGPFTEAKEVVAGFWIVQVSSLAEAKEWFQRCPGGDGTEIQLRPVYELEEFGDSLPSEVRDLEEQVRTATRQDG
ncbi:YciI family protein [Microlunatus elymi]|uniref:YciI family protein n=1 Tax=Microlunatus elymi TaxID=2596828 RepID=A0A516Q3C0_9ACTN|nr:YciI family protein [Microlunatus elymi]QDP97925.1 YciI family protein [Microlunatus elymi]